MASFKYVRVTCGDRKFEGTIIVSASLGLIILEPDDINILGVSINFSQILGRNISGSTVQLHGLEGKEICSIQFPAMNSMNSFIAIIDPTGNGRNSDELDEISLGTTSVASASNPSLPNVTRRK